MTDGEYFNALIKNFPSLEEEIRSWEPFVHLRMERFADYTISQFEKGNRDELKKCFDFQESMIERMNPDLYNALNVSYCESILLSGNQALKHAVSLMPSRLRRIYLDYEKWYNDLANSR